MGWAILILLAATALIALLWAVRPGRGVAMLIVAGPFVALAGYAWQGSPALPGRPTAPRAANPPGDTLFAAERPAWMERMGGDAQALDAADALIRNGDPDYALAVLRGAIGRRPDSAMLWIGLANGLVTYADGSVTPPARYAFDHAAALAPGDPAPAYFKALAYAQSGDLDTAEKIWRALLAAAPRSAPWRGRVAEKLMLLQTIRAAVRRAS